MYLITFDIIESRSKEVYISDIITDSIIDQYCHKYGIDRNLIEIYGGDQLRLLHDNPHQLLEILIETFKYLYTNKLTARCFISHGQLNLKTGKISSATGEIFYSNRQLEADVKQDKKIKVNSVFYTGAEKTSELQLIFATLNKLVLHKPEYLEALYYYQFRELSQVETANLIGISQSTVNNQLNKVNHQLISSYNQVISKLIEEELCKVEN